MKHPKFIQLITSPGLDADGSKVIIAPELFALGEDGSVWQWQDKWVELQ